MRYSDIITLEPSHVKDNWIKKTMAKTGKEVLIPIDKLFNGKALAILQKYNNDPRKLVKGMTTNSIANKFLKRLFNEAKIEGYVGRKLSFHTARHTCASLLSESGLAKEAIQLILGHTKMSMTEIYMNDSKESKLSKLIENANI